MLLKVTSTRQRLFNTLARILHATGFMLVLILTPTAHALEKVTLQLKWEHAFQFAGYYAALEQGYYRDAGLEVTITPAKPGEDSLVNVLNGRAEYGVSNSSLLLARQAGQPVVVLAVIFQHSPLALIMPQGTAATSIHSLLDKRIMIEPQSDELFAYLKQEGIPFSRIKQMAHTNNPQDLIDGKVDAISAYITAEPYFLNRAGFEYLTLSPRSAGIDFYGDNLFTTERELSAHPERAKAFREASLRGWQYAMAHPKEMAALIYSKYNNTHPKNYYLFEAEQMVQLIRPDLIEIGYMSTGRWQHISDTYADIGLIPKDFSLKGFLYQHDPEADLKPLYIATSLLLLISIFSIYIYRIKAKLERSVAENTKINRDLANSEAMFRTLSANTAAGIFVVDNKKISFANQALADIAGYSRDTLYSLNYLELIHPDHRPMVIDYGTRRAHGLEVPNRYECKFLTSQNEVRWAELSISLITLNDERVSIGTVYDISDRKIAEDELQLAAKVFSHAREGIMITNAFNRIVEVNDMFCEITGYPRAEVLGKNPRFLTSGRQSPEFYRDMWQTLSDTGGWTGEMWNRRKGGGFYAEMKTISVVYDHKGQVQNYVALFSDITQIKVYQEKLEHVAHYDTLTGLPNRLLLSDRLTQATIRAQRNHQLVGVAYLDLDGFKAVNDTHGHALGDELLVALAARMKTALREGDTLARIGGDEFIAILGDLETINDAHPVLQRLLSTAAQPILINGIELLVSASIGVAIYPRDGSEADLLIRCADHAMYQAKQTGKNRFFIFPPTEPSVPTSD